MIVKITYQLLSFTLQDSKHFKSLFCISIKKPSWLPMLEKRTFYKPLRKEVSKLAAAESFISAIKHSQGAAKLKVRTYPKVSVVIGF
jgi:hypothetical protein